MQHRYLLILALAALLLLAACSGGQEVELATAPMAEDADMMASEEMASDEMASDEMASDEMASDKMASDEMASEEMVGEAEAMAEEMGEPAMDRPAWQTLALTDVRTGESFTLADFAGQTVFVEPMATWCTNCRRQLENVKDAQAQLAGQDVVFVALSVETTIDDATLASYADEAGFDWLFAVLSPEMLQELAAEFGQTIANPPATPHFVIRPDGTVASLYTGIEPADRIVDQIQLAQG